MSATVRRRSDVLPESLGLALLCLIDMILTLWVVESGLAIEANPIMRFYYEISPLAFALAKTFLFVGPLFVLERLHERNPRFIRGLLRVAVVLYATLYVSAVAVVN